MARHEDEEGYQPHPGDPWHPEWQPDGDDDAGTGAEIDAGTGEIDAPRRRGLFGRRRKDRDVPTEVDPSDQWPDAEPAGPLLDDELSVPELPEPGPIDAGEAGPSDDGASIEDLQAALAALGVEDDVGTDESPDFAQEMVATAGSAIEDLREIAAEPGDDVEEWREFAAAEDESVEGAPAEGEVPSGKRGWFRRRKQRRAEDEAFWEEAESWPAVEGDEESWGGETPAAPGGPEDIDDLAVPAEGGSEDWSGDGVVEPVGGAGVDEDGVWDLDAVVAEIGEGSAALGDEVEESADLEPGPFDVESGWVGSGAVPADLESDDAVAAEGELEGVEPVEPVVEAVVEPVVEPVGGAGVDEDGVWDLDAVVAEIGEGSAALGDEVEESADLEPGPFDLESGWVGSGAVPADLEADDAVAADGELEGVEPVEPVVEAVVEPALPHEPPLPFETPADDDVEVAPVEADDLPGRLPRSWFAEIDEDEVPVPDEVLPEVEEPAPRAVGEAAAQPAGDTDAEPVQEATAAADGEAMKPSIAAPETDEAPLAADAGAVAPLADQVAGETDGAQWAPDEGGPDPAASTAEVAAKHPGSDDHDPAGPAAAEATVADSYQLGEVLGEPSEELVAVDEALDDILADVAESAGVVDDLMPLDPRGAAAADDEATWWDEGGEQSEAGDTWDDDEFRLDEPPPEIDGEVAPGDAGFARDAGDDYEPQGWFARRRARRRAAERLGAEAIPQAGWDEPVDDGWDKEADPPDHRIGIRDGEADADDAETRTYDEVGFAEPEPAAPTEDSPELPPFDHEASAVDDPVDPTGGFDSGMYAGGGTTEHRGLAELIARSETEETEFQAVTAHMEGLGSGVVGFEDVQDLGSGDEYVEPAASDLGMRVLTGVTLLAFLGASLWAGGEAMAVFIGLLVALGLAEFYGTLRTAGYRPLTIVGLLGGAGTLVAVWFMGLGAVPGGILSVTVLSFFLYSFAPSRRDALTNGGLTVLGVAWLPGLAAFAYPIVASPDFRVLILGLAAATVAMDVGAYFAGRAWGTRKLAPVLSPNKTVEGLAGGTVLAIGAAIAVGLLFEPFDIRSGAALGLVVAVTAPVGDLAESMVKRSLGVKDMGSILPGHGGILDRVDAFLFVLPAVWILYETMGFLG